MLGKASLRRHSGNRRKDGRESGLEEVLCRMAGAKVLRQEHGRGVGRKARLSGKEKSK